MTIRLVMGYARFAIVVCGVCASVAIAGGQPASRETPISRSETETLVKQDLAERLKVPVDRLKVVSAFDRTWPDATLGCGARKGLMEPAPVRGFAFTLAYADKQYTYHSDRNGRFKRCDAGKRLGPISR